MKYKVLTLIAASCIHLIAFAQKTVDMPLEKGETTLDFVNLQEHGFVLKTGKDKNYSKDLDWQLSYYTPTLELIWEVPIETTQINKGISQDIIACPSGSFVYHLEKRIYTIGASDLFLTQINRKGEVKTHEVDQQTFKDMKGKTVFRFCDEQYLYFINLDEDGDKNEGGQFFVHQISHADFSLQTKTIKLPLVDKSFTEWEYVTHNDEHLWLASKALTDKPQSYQCQIVALDWQGKVTHKTTLNHQVENLYLRPSVNHRYIPGADGFSNGGIRVMSTTNHTTGMTYTNASLGKSAYGGILVDEENNRIYAYGLYGNSKGVGNGYVDGYYLSAYNLEGQKQWQQISTESDPLTEDSYFRKHTPEYLRSTVVYLTKDHHIRLQIGGVKNIFTHEFAEDGKKLKSYANTFKNGVGYNSYFLCFDPKHPASQYYQEHFSKKSVYYGSNFSDNSILIENDNKSKISLLQW